MGERIHVSVGRWRNNLALMREAKEHNPDIQIETAMQKRERENAECVGCLRNARAAVKKSTMLRRTGDRIRKDDRWSNSSAGIRHWVWYRQQASTSKFYNWDNACQRVWVQCVRGWSATRTMACYTSRCRGPRCLLCIGGCCKVSHLAFSLTLTTLGCSHINVAEDTAPVGATCACELCQAFFWTHALATKSAHLPPSAGKGR